MTNFTDILQSTLKESFFNLTLYTVFGIAAFWLVWKGLKNVWRWRRIQPQSEQRKHFFSHDVLFSFGSILLAGFLTALIALLDQCGYMKLYWDIIAYGTTWGILQLFFLLFFYDAYFYWSHRFMHHPKIYRWVHKTHHNMHHEKFNGNYGLYFTFWDKWMKTEFMEYSKRFDAVYESKT